MRKLINLLACTAIVSLCAVAVSCSDNEPEKGGNGGGNELSDVTVMAYYAGDYYEVGAGNIYINFSHGNISEEYDEYGDITGYAGTGSVLCIDLNQALADDPDHVVLTAGTYTVDDTESYAIGVVNGLDSYYLNVVNGNAEQCTFTSGSVAIENLGDNIYKFDYDLTGSNGEAVKGSYKTLVRVINRSDEGVMSNLDTDIKANDLTKAMFVYEGDLYETGESDMYIMMLGDKDFDISTNYGPGNCVMLTLNVTPGASDGIPAGTYSSFVDILFADELPVGSCVAGLYFWGQYFGCWYFNDSMQYEAALWDGSVKVEKSGETYTVTGTLLDGVGHSVEFTYSGTPVIVDDTQAASLSARKSTFKLRK